jgi:hypothetical protein
MMQLSLEIETDQQPNIKGYDRYLVAFSGGKDSIASLLALLDAGVERSKIELHHHLVDGREGSDLFDWPVTEDYCRKFAQAMGIPIYFSWLEGGLEREMLRANQAKAATIYETPKNWRQQWKTRNPPKIPSNGSRPANPVVQQLRKNRRIRRTNPRPTPVPAQSHPSYHWRTRPGKRQPSQIPSI